MEPPDRRRWLAGILCLSIVVGRVDAATSPGALETARAAIRIKEFSRAVAVLSPAAGAGDANAQFLLASLYRVGLGTAADPVAARILLTKAAKQQHAAAAYSLAAMLAHDAPRDPIQSRAWLERAAQSGHLLAKATLERGALPLEFRPQADLTEAGARRAAFRRAIQDDDTALAGALIDRELAGATDEFGRGALAYAAQSGTVHMIALLIANQAAVDRADSFGMTPLMLAAQTADGETIDRLLQAHANADAADRVGNTALMYAAARSVPDASVVDRLVRATTLPQAMNAQGWSALDWAVSANATVIADLLRERGLKGRRITLSDIDAPQVPLRHAGGDADLYSGLPDVQIAAARTSPDLLKAVLASPSPTQVPAGALLSATVAGSQPTLQMLLNAGNGKFDSQAQASTLLWAVRHSDPAVVATLVGKGTVSRRADLEAPALIAAVRAHRVDNVRALLGAGVAADARDESGMSALMIASATAQTEAVSELLSYLARTDFVDRSGRNAVWYASAAGADAVLDALLAARSPPDIPDASGQTPLAVAAAHGHAKIVAAQLRAGASASTLSATGSTPLMLAARCGNVAVIQALLSAGAPIDAQNRFGDTALIVAARSAQSEAVKVLLAAGASDRLRNADRASALDVAAALGLDAIGKLLARS